MEPFLYAYGLLKGTLTELFTITYSNPDKKNAYYPKLRLKKASRNGVDALHGEPINAAEPLCYPKAPCAHIVYT